MKTSPASPFRAKMLCAFAAFPLLALQISARAAEPGPDVIEFSSANNFKGLFGANEVKLEPKPDGLTIKSEGDDPVVGLPTLKMAPGGQVSVTLQISSPSDTTLQLFFKTTNQTEFDDRHVISKPIRKGANEVRLQITDPQFSGILRLDPGMAPGDYLLKNLELKSTGPISILEGAPVSSVLAKQFEAAHDVLLKLRSPSELAVIKVLNQATLQPAPDGVSVEATGPDPELALPDFAVKPVGGVLVFLEIESPVATTLQLFYKVPGLLEYDEKHFAAQEILPGKNSVYLELRESAITGTLRLDPGMSPGTYKIRAFEVRAAGNQAGAR